MRRSLQPLTDMYIESGMSPGDAYRAARDATFAFRYASSLPAIHMPKKRVGKAGKRSYPHQVRLAKLHELQKQRRHYRHYHSMLQRLYEDTKLLHARFLRQNIIESQSLRDIKDIDSEKFVIDVETWQENGDGR